MGPWYTQDTKGYDSLSPTVKSLLFRLEEAKRIYTEEAGIFASLVLVLVFNWLGLCWSLLFRDDN